jgi:glycosyltransferase involved in cell wall biosynthesis
MIKVSIILPIYNVAPYLEEAFESIINQTLKEIEIIAVNDGSTDNSQEVIEKYTKQDERIIALSQNNQGLSGARNTALLHAKGEYIYMMDSDDVLSSPDALQTCYEYAKKNQADFIFFDGERFMDGSNQSISKIARTHLVKENIQYRGEYLLNLMLDKNVHNSVVWLLLINKQYLDSTGLQFYSGIIHEDELFTTILTLNSNSIYCIKQSFVKHRIRPTSIMGNKYTKKNIDCYLTVFDELFKYQDSTIIRKFAKYTLSKVFYTGHIIPLKDKPHVFWRAITSGYIKYIGIKSTLVFWLKFKK